MIGRRGEARRGEVMCPGRQGDEIRLAEDGR
jgi:hypothetical protein